MHGSDDAGLHALLDTCIHRHNIERLKKDWVDVYRDINTGSTTSKGIHPTAFAIGPHRSVKDENVRRTTSQKNYLPITKPVPYVVIRINSSDRKINITERNECAKRGIQQCVVVDREKQKIKVYSFDDEYYNDEHDDINQYPQFMGRTTCNHVSGRERCEYKYKKVFRNEEVVRVRYLYELKLTAGDLLNPIRSALDLFIWPFESRKDIEFFSIAVITTASAAEEVARAAAEVLNEASRTLSEVARALSEVARVTNEVERALDEVAGTLNKVVRAWWATLRARNNSSVGWEDVLLATWGGKGKHERMKFEQKAMRLSKEVCNLCDVVDNLTRSVDFIMLGVDNLSQESEKLSQEADKVRKATRKARKEASKAFAEFKAYSKWIIRTNSKKRVQEQRE